MGIISNNDSKSIENKSGKTKGFEFMDQSAIKLFQCLLCRGALPAEKGDIFINHLQEQHRTFFNFEFLFAAFKLSDIMIKEAIEFIEDRTDMNANNLETIMNEEIKTFKNYEKDISETLEEEPMPNFEKETKLEMEDTNIEIPSLKPKQAEVKNLDKKKKKLKKKSKTLMCDCKLNSKSGKVRRFHLRVIHDNQFGCHSCQIAFKTEEILKKHLSKNKCIKKIYKMEMETTNLCPECGVETSDKNKLASHMKAHDQNVYICDLCSVEIKGKVAFRRHKTRFHREKQPCQYCGKVVKKIREHILRRHTRNEDKKYQCKDCGTGYINKELLKIHERIHTNERPFICRLGCGFTARTAGNRTVHEKKTKHKKTNDMENERPSNK